MSQPSIVDLRPHVWAGSTSSFTVSIRYRAGAFEADTAFIASLLDPPAPGVSQGRAAAELRETLYEPDAGSIGDAFSAENLRAPKLESPPSTFGSNDATLARLVYKLALFVAPGATETPWHALEGDCRHVCRLSSAFPSRAASAGELIGEALRVELARLGLIAERRVLAVHGSAAWDRIFVRNESSADIVAVVQLTPKGGVSSIAFFDSRSESGRVLARARVFDRRWRLIGDVDLGGFDASQEIRAVSRAPRATGETVVLCEPSVLSSTLAAQGVLPMLTRGPHASDDPRAGALHGWLANPRGRSGDYWDGVARVNGIISHSPHAALVARTFIEASGDSPGRFALATPRTCLAHFDETSESFRRAGVKILNFSGGESESRAACAASPFARPFRNASSGFLWILASGNNREENPDFRCPQTLGPRADLLVVAGLPIGSTDYGRRYADLAAEQTGPDRRLGSSFAAPRVSAAAQAVARREPSLTPEDIRIVILASVRIPRGPSGALAPLAVRSGGALDPEAALRAAAQATQIKRGSQTIALDDLFRRLYDPLEASARVRWARDSGLLEPRAR